jgi:hypothetical protein
MLGRTLFAILLLLLTACSPTSSPQPPLPQPTTIAVAVPGPIVASGQQEIRDLAPTTETVWNCGSGGGTVVKHPAMSVLTNHAVEWQVGATTGVGVTIGEGVIPGGVNLSATLEGRVANKFDQGIMQGTGWDLPAETNTIVLYTLMWREVWQPGYVDVQLANQSVSRVNVRYRIGIQSEIIGKQIQRCGTEQPPTTAPGITPPKPTNPPPTSPPLQSAACFPQTGWTPPRRLSSGEWIYDCLSAGSGNWVGQDESWKATNWKRGTGQSEIVNIVVPIGAVRMGLGCDPCTVLKPDGTTISSPNGEFGPFKPNISFDVSPGQIYKVRIFGGDQCPTRQGVVPPCSPEIYIWFNLPK